jgi:hypothetical protein
MMDIVVGALLALLFISMALLIICPLYWMITDNYYFKVRYCGVTGHCHTEYFSVRAASLKRAYKKARNYANESCMAHEYIDYISLM